MKGAHWRGATVFLAVTAVVAVLLASGLSVTGPRARAEEQPSLDQQARQQKLQDQYSHAIQLFNEGEYAQAKSAFERLEAMAEELDVKLGDQTKENIAEFLRQIDAQSAEAEPAEPAEPEEPAGPSPEELARQARVAELEGEYAEAVALYKAEKYEEAKAVFHAIAAAGAREGLTLSQATEKGLRRYIGRIDADIADAASARQAEAGRAAAEAERAAADQKRAEEEAEKAAADEELREKLAEAARKERIAAAKAQAEAQALYDQAMDLRKQGQLPEALATLDRAASTDPENTAVQEAMAELRRELGHVSPERLLLEEQARLRAVRIERDAQQMEQDLAQAKELVKDDEYVEALRLLNAVATKAAVGDYPAQMKQDLVQRAEKSIRDTEKDKADYDAKMAARRVKDAEREAKKLARRERIAREDQVDRLFTRAEDMFVDKRYAEAKSAIMNILELEPTNGDAEAYLYVIDRADYREKFLDHATRRTAGLREEFAATAKGSIPLGVEKTIVYPETWKELTRRRRELIEADRADVSIEEQAVRDKLQRPVDLNFAETPLEDVVEFLRTVADVNIVVDHQRVQGDMPVTLSLRSVKLGDALDFIMDMLNLKWIIRRGTIFISDTSGVQAEAFMLIYDIRDLIGTVPDFAGPEFDLESESGGGGDTGGFDFADSEGAEEAGLGEFVSSSTTGQEIADLIMENVARDTWQLAGGRNSITFRDGNLIVVNTAEVHDEIRQLLEGLRKARALQVSMDIRFIRAADDFIVEVGAGITNSTYARQENTVAFQIVPPASGLGSGRNPFTGGGIALGGLSLVGSFLDRLQVDYFMDALQGAEGSVLLSAPRITVFNGQRAYIAVVTSRNLVTDIDVDVSESAVGYDVQIDTVDTGIVFDVRPIVSADRRYVQMDLRPSRSELISVTSFNVGYVVLPGGGIQQLTIQQPVLETTELRTTVSVPDGGTLLVGGLKFSFEQEREFGVPILSQIPIINRLITRTSAVREKDNLLILVTPRIIIQEELEAEME